MADFSLGSFNKRINRRADQLEKSVRRVLKETSSAAHHAFTINTPVDTGNARSNTKLGVLPDTSASDNKQIGGLSAATGHALAQANSVLSRLGGNVMTLYLTNGVDYIRKLDAGFISRKGGFMRAAAVMAGKSAARREIAKGLFRG